MEESRFNVRQLGARFKQVLTGRLAWLIAVFCLFGELLIRSSKQLRQYI